jgi:hypothetical protein
VRGVLFGACIAALGACDDAVAIEVVVPEGMDADEVALFIPLDPCKVETATGFVACDSLVGDNNIPLGSDARILALDTMLAHDPADGAGTYEFRLEPGERDFIPLLVAVSLVDDKPTGAVVFQGFLLSEGPARRRATLGPTADFKAPDPSNATGVPRGVHVWSSERSDGNASHCVEVQTDAEVIAIVDSKDPDCDGFTDRETTGEGVECLPLEWNGGFASDPNAAPTCSLPEEDTGRCFLGNDGCQDGVGRDTCASKHICVAGEVCADCASDLTSCFEVLRGDPMINTAHVDCFIKANDDGQGNLLGCNAGEVTSLVPVDLGPLFATVNCNNISFAPLGDGLALDTNTYIDGKVELAGPNSLRFDLAVNRVDTDTCKFGFQWQAPQPLITPTAPSIVESTMLIDVIPLNGGSATQMLLPVRFEFQSCEGAMLPGFCKLDGSPASLQSVALCAP